MLKVPLAFSGIPIKGVNNPILVLFAEFKESPIFSGTLPSEFFETFKEATGFSCKKAEEIINNERYSIPFSSYYIFASKRYVDLSIELCDLPISEDEKFEILNLIDDALFDSSLIKALRTAQKNNHSLLYREGEEPVFVEASGLVLKYLGYFPLIEDVRYIDDALIHLSGTLVLDFVTSFSEKLIDVENSLWDLIYGLKVPYSASKFKWIWDDKYASIVEIINLPNILSPGVQ